jgi:hypothetical protein
MMMSRSLAKVQKVPLFKGDLGGSNLRKRSSVPKGLITTARIRFQGDSLARSVLDRKISFSLFSVIELE